MSQTEIEQLRDRITQLEAVIASMTEAVRAPAPEPVEPSGEAAGAPDAPTRRHLLRAAAAATGAAVIATVVAVDDAGAIDPNDLALGTTNQTTSGMTEGDYMGSVAGAGFLFQAGNAIAPTNVAFANRSAALAGATTRGAHPTGVLGYSEASAGTGVWAAATGSGSIGLRAEGTTGVVATSTTADGTAVLGTGSGGYGVRGVSTSNVGVVGNSTSSYGVFGAGTTGVRGDGSAFGVRGEGLGSGIGVEGNAAGSGAGVSGSSISGDGVYGNGPTGVHGEALSGGFGVFGAGGSAGVGVRATGGTGVSAVGTNTGVGGDASPTSGTGVSGYGLFGVKGAGERYALVADRARVAAVMLRPDADFAATPRTPPPTRSDVHAVGELDIDGNGDLWLCTVAGTPGTWRKIAGPATAGAFHAVTPGRVYDSRVAIPGPATPLAAGQERTVSVRDRRSISDGTVALADFVPAGATAIAANVTVVETVAAGFLTVNPGGAHEINAATVNWSASGQILNNGVILTLDANRELNVIAGGGGASTHFVIDVTGYYR